jgi:glutathione S-transferase
VTNARPLLLCDRGCPFAHRVLALLDHLSADFEHRESAVGDKPEGLAAYSRSGRIPLLVHGELIVTESRVMLEHLAEHFGFAAAYPTELEARTRHRHAMAVVDDFLAPLLMADVTSLTDTARLDDALAALEAATAGAPPAPGLLAFHLAPIWLRFRWWQPEGAVTRALEQHRALSRWLDAAVHLDAVSHTAPERGAHMQDVARARAAGLMTCPIPSQATAAGEQP